MGVRFNAILNANWTASEGESEKQGKKLLRSKGGELSESKYQPSSTDSKDSGKQEIFYLKICSSLKNILEKANFKANSFK